jgi:hypothetical protein
MDKKSKIFKPEGWTFMDDKKNLMADKKEDEYHTNGSYYNDPDGKFGAAKVGGGNKSSFGGTNEESPKGDAPKGVGSIDIPQGHIVVEEGTQNFRTYYLVHDDESDKFYVVIPNAKGEKEYRGPKRTLKSAALEDGYKVLNISLPEDAWAQLRRRSPESLPTHL